MVLGLVVFLIGAVVLIAVFALAYGVYSSAVTDIGSDALTLVLVRRGVQLAALFVIAYAASLLCSKGIQLFSAARSSHE